MGLFDKKFCDVCGEKISLMGNRKLEDGNLCKDCAKKLSPFFSERRRSTVEDIKRQLEYRAENERQLSGFTPNLTIDGSRKVYIDTIGERFIVTGQSNWRSSNPDLISFSQVRRVNTEVRENKDEIFYEDADGNERSYEPRRYSCNYSFHATIYVDSPWFDEIQLEISDGRKPDSPYTDLYREYEHRMHQLADILQRRDNNHRVWDGDGMAQRTNTGYGQPVQNGYGNAGQPGYGAAQQGYSQPPQQGYPGAQQQGYANAPQPSVQTATAGALWVCAACGAQNNGKFCQNCGGLKPSAPMGCAGCGWRPMDGQAIPKFCPACGRPLS